MKQIQGAIESLHAKSLCPRLHVDVTHADAVCPDFVRERWKERLVIDLDSSYPLDLAFTEVGVEADLSFGGYVTRCTFPWAAIYIVGERDSGRSRVFAGNIPASLRHELAPSQASKLNPKLTEVRDDARAKKRSRRRKRRGAEREPEPASPLQAVAAVEDEDGDGGEDTSAAEDTSSVSEPETSEPESTEPETTEDAPSTAQSRRSAFKVIDGGG